MLSLLVVAACLGAVTAAPGRRDESLNHYLDLVFDNLQVLLVENGFDPAPLPNSSVGFSDVVLGVEWHGEASVYDGWLKGIASIYRSSDSSFIKDESGTVLGISSGLGLRDMKGHYQCLAQFMDLGPIADVVIFVNGASITFEAALDRTLCRFQVSRLEVERIGHISVDIDGLGPLSWIFEIVAELVINVVELFLRTTIEESMFSLVNNALNSVDLSILGPVLGCVPAHM